MLADPGRLEQVVVNLLTNAEKFSPEGSVVHLEVAEQGGCAMLTVSDNGPGITAPEKQRIFERFYRGPRERPGAGYPAAVSGWLLCPK